MPELAEIVWSSGDDVPHVVLPQTGLKAEQIIKRVADRQPSPDPIEAVIDEIGIIMNSAWRQQ